MTQTIFRLRCDPETTRRYVNMGDRLTQAVAGLYVPNVKALEAIGPTGSMQNRT